MVLESIILFVIKNKVKIKPHPAYYLRNITIAMTIVFGAVIIFNNKVVEEKMGRIFIPNSSYSYHPSNIDGGGDISDSRYELVSPSDPGSTAKWDEIKTITMLFPFASIALSVYLANLFYRIDVRDQFS